MCPMTREDQFVLREDLLKTTVAPGAVLTTVAQIGIAGKMRPGVAQSVELRQVDIKEARSLGLAKENVPRFVQPSGGAGLGNETRVSAF